MARVTAPSTTTQGSPSERTTHVAAPAQLPLLSEAARTPVAPAGQAAPFHRPVPAALRLSEKTRRVGLAGVAQARAVLAEQAARRAAAEAATSTEARRTRRAA